MTDGDVKPVATTPKAIKIALAVSVAINLGVAGLIAGFALNSGLGGHGDRMVREMGFGPFDRVFSTEDRIALRQTIVGRLEDFRSMRQQVQDDMAAILSALQAEPFDKAAVVAAFDAQARHLTDGVKLGSTVVRDYVMAMSPEARLAFSSRLDQVVWGGGERDQVRGGPAE